VKKLANATLLLLETVIVQSTRSRSPSKMLRWVQKEIFTFESAPAHLPRKLSSSSTSNLDSLSSRSLLTSWRSSPAGLAAPIVATPDGALEHEVQELLRFKMRYGRPHVLVSWAGCDA
jgi:hypothetical protein